MPAKHSARQNNHFSLSFEIRDAKCGKIQCQSSASKPLQSNAVAIDTTIRTQRMQLRCRGTHVYRSDSEEKEMLDPGLVLTGTKCGSHHVGIVLPVMAWGKVQESAGKVLCDFQAIHLCLMPF